MWKKIIYLVLAELAIFSVGYGLTGFFPHRSPFIWLIVAAVAIGAMLLVWLYGRWSIIGIHLFVSKWLTITVVILVMVLLFLLIWYWLDDSEHSTRRCLQETLPKISWAVEEKNTQHFENELRILYPQLEKCGLKVPLVDPVKIKHHQYDSTWYGFHLTFLKVLRQWIRNDEININQWNADVDRENAKRRKVANRFLRREESK